MPLDGVYFLVIFLSNQGQNIVFFLVNVASTFQCFINFYYWGIYNYYSLHSVGGNELSLKW